MPSADRPRLAGGDARAGDPEPVSRPWLVRLRRALAEDVENLNFRLILANLAVRLLPSGCFCRLRTAIYRLAGLRIGAHSLILGRMEFTGSGFLQKRLRIGSYTIINEYFFADVNADVIIGDRVAIGHHVTLVTAEHDIGPAACRAGKIRPAPISLDDGCWIGACSTVLPGVRIGKSSIVAAGSVVSGSVPENRVVGGVPARALKTLPSEP